MDFESIKWVAFDEQPTGYCSSEIKNYHLSTLFFFITPSLYSTDGKPKRKGVLFYGKRHVIFFNNSTRKFDRKRPRLCTLFEPCGKFHTSNQCFKSDSDRGNTTMRGFG